jgi:hypothetical protein
MEINRAEGGYKNVVTVGKVIPIVINTYGRLVYQNVVSNEFVPVFTKESDNYTTSSQLLDVQDELTKAKEFTENRKRSDQYKVTSVALTIDYNRIPQAGDRVSKLLLGTETDTQTSLAQAEMKRENNIMKISMATNGTKNYNTTVTAATTIPDNRAWQSSEYTWAGIWKIRISQMDKTELTRLNDENEFVLGTWKLSIRILIRLTDVDNMLVSMNTKPSLIKMAEQINELKKKLEEKEEINNKLKEALEYQKH